MLNAAQANRKGTRFLNKKKEFTQKTSKNPSVEELSSVNNTEVGSKRRKIVSVKG